MLRYLVKRICMIIPVLVVVLLVSFAITHIMPGDPVRMMLGDFANETQIAEMNKTLGFDKPIAVQFKTWIDNVIRGDLGESIFLHEKVTKVIVSRLEPTIILAILGEIIGILIGVPLGILAAIKHRTWVDQSAIGVSLFGVSVPSFWLSLMLMLLFGVKLNWLPVYGYQSFSEVGIGCIKYLILPAVTIGVMQSGLIARMTRSSMLEILKQDYIRTARLKGVPNRLVLFKHCLKNAMPPVMTIIGFSIAVLLGGTWVVETVFNIPGTGALAMSAILKRDYPVIQGCMMFTAFIYLGVNLIIDISYAFLNPRVRVE
ncbi:MAG: ABC transporter permease [Tissierellales bacterium]|nr:ABC transporter permease [Tissierellales bacterium]